ncbi:MAG: alpha/beta fold hydrolase [Betaproteobacteria bacterium]|nr:alpha/beta fold hydrolase [Betaproteobacteria bacterium]
MSPRARRTGRAAARGFALVAGLALLGYAGIVGGLYALQEKLIFPASTLPADYKFAFDLPFEELRIPVPGAELSTLHFRQPEPRGLVFFLHGNGGDLSSWTTNVDFYRRVNYDLFIIDYRGYGKSTGRIESEAQLHADVRAAWDAVAPAYRARKLPIVIYGRSLGTGLAAYLARDVNPALLMLVTPFTSLAAAATRAYPFVPEWVLKYPLRTDAVIGAVKSPVLLVHGTRDTLIPLADSERLHALARSPAELLVIEGAGHNDIHQFPVYLEGLAARLNAVAGG